jgi:hypothetical protein
MKGGELVTGTVYDVRESGGTGAGIVYLEFVDLTRDRNGRITGAMMQHQRGARYSVRLGAVKRAVGSWANVEDELEQHRESMRARRAEIDARMAERDEALEHLHAVGIMASPQGQGTLCISTADAERIGAALALVAALEADGEAGL